MEAKGRIPPKPPEVDPMSQAMERRMKQLAGSEKLRLLISGEVPAPNEMVAYLIEQYKQSRAEYEATDANVRRLQAQLTTSKEKLLVLQGGVNKYLEDLEHWVMARKKTPANGDNNSGKKEEPEKEPEPEKGETP